MSERDQTFGRASSQARKALGWSQKELAQKILRADGESISPQYLNDIEHDRRSPSSDRMVQQFANVLGMGSGLAVLPRRQVSGRPAGTEVDAAGIREGDGRLPGHAEQEMRL